MSFVLWSPGSDQAKLACTTQNTSAHRQSTQVQGRSYELSSAPEEQWCSRRFLMLPDGFMCRWWRRKGTVSPQASIRCFDHVAALQAQPRPSATIRDLLVAGSTEGEKGTHSSLLTSQLVDTCAYCPRHHGSNAGLLISMTTCFFGLLTLHCGTSQPYAPC